MEKILVIGSANTDFVIHTNKMPKCGETITGKDFFINAGGKGLNQAVAISKLGGDVSFLGAVGLDGNGDILISTLKENHIPFTGIRTKTEATGIAIVTVVNGDNFIILNPGANNLLTPKIIGEKKQLIADADYVVLQLEIPLETVIAITKIAKENHTKVILNPAPYKELPDEIFSNIDILIPNEHEVEELTGICVNNQENCIDAIKYIKGKDVQTVIITLGERGCVYNDEDEILFCPSQKVDVVDTTSAGDSFIGALCVKLASGHDLSDAIVFANQVAAITVSRNGASVSIPYASEL